MKVLVVGGGAREHALVWKLFSSAAVREVFCAPGNAGTAVLARSVPIRHDDVPSLVAWARQEQIDLAVVGPEGPLALGIVDHFAVNGLVCVGPTQAAATIETSKVWAKDLLVRHGIPTGRARVAEDPATALNLARQMGFPVAIKADGLAAGKGVVIAHDEEEARATLTDFMVDRTLGESGARVLIEEFLEGDEISVLAFTDGRDLAVMPVARDYKRLGDGDSGPNTGGMGAFAPVPYVDQGLLDQIRSDILEPTIAALAGEGRPFKGVLYGGLILTRDGPKVLEFNCRFGDPEAQAILPLLETDLLDIFQAIAAGELGRLTIEWTPRLATCVVVAASTGYPGAPKVGYPIRGFDAVESGALVFHGATRRDKSGRHVVTAGGRVLCVVGRGRDLAEARAQAYRGIGEIGFEGMVFRTDIAEHVEPRTWQRETSPRPAALAEATPAPAAAPISPPSVAPSPAPVAVSSPEASTLVGIVGAAEADQQLMEIVRAECARRGVDGELATIEPYRAPETLRDWAESARRRGARVLVAIGGAAPHLPGLLAAMTSLPVIGVATRGAATSAAEALLALLALPPGVALAVAGLDEAGARNAAALALAILATSGERLASTPVEGGSAQEAAR